MKKLYLIAFASLLSAAMNAQGTPESPQPITDGEYTLTIDDGNFRQTMYYVYTAGDENRLLSMTLPTTSAAVTASYTSGNHDTSDISTFCVPDNSNETTLFSCFAPKDTPVYLRVVLQTLAFPAGTTSASMQVTSEPCAINHGLDCTEPIQAHDGTTVFLPLTVQVDPPFMPVPVYVAYTAEHDGWLYLNFKPSVTSVYYASSCDGTFTMLKHEYITENGRTTGAKALIQVEKGEFLIFKISGFNGTMLTTVLENPVPGTSCDFPLDITEGEHPLPAEAGDFYYRITPATEGYIELNSNAPLADGYVEVMMDCNKFGSFTIYDDFHLRTWVYDRMEYLVHIAKGATDEGATFSLAVTEPLPCDEPDTAEILTPGEEYTTPPYAGTYYYKISAPAERSTLKLQTLAEPENNDTRVNLHAPDDLFISLARGLALTYDAEPSAEYILKWTVFDNDHALPFKIIFDKNTGVESADSEGVRIAAGSGYAEISGSDVPVRIYAPDGRPEAEMTVNGTVRIPLPAGIHIVSCGSCTTKISVNK